MFHVKHYSLISEFYKKVNYSLVTNVDVSSLIDLIYSDSEKKLIIYKDSMYGSLVDKVELDWDSDRVLIIAPKDYSEIYSPSGFNEYNPHSIKYFCV